MKIEIIKLERMIYYLQKKRKNNSSRKEVNKQKNNKI